MKKTVLFILCLLLAGGAFAEEVATPLAGGQPLSTGPLDTPVAFPGKTGGLFLAGIGTGGLKALYSADNGASFTPASIDWNGRAFSSVRTLKLYERFANDYLVFFIGRDGNDEGLYALAETSAGRLQLLNGRFDDPSNFGSIVSYDIRAERRQSFLAASLKTGAFSVVPVAENGAIQPAIRVSQFGETALAFEIQDKMDKGALNHWGVYLSERSGLKSLVFYSIKDGRVESCIDTAGFSRNEDVVYKIARDKTGGYYVVYSTNGDIFTVRVKNNRIDLLNAGRALNEGKSDATLEAAVSGDNGVSVVYRTGASESGTIWAAEIETKIDAKTTVSSVQLNQGAIKGGIKLFQYGVGDVLLGFIETIKGTNTLHILKKSSFTGIWRDLYGVKMVSGGVLDFSFTVLSNGSSIFEILTEDRQGLKSVFQRIENSNSDKLEKMWECVMENELPQGEYSLHYSGDSLVRRIGGNTYIISPVSSRIERITRLNSAETIEAGRSHLLSCSDGRLYRLADDQPAPPPAVWTYGYALQSTLGLYRVYFGEEKANGEFKAEVQCVGYEAPVWWGDLYQGETGEYMREFVLKPGETKELTAEVWNGDRRLAIFSGQAKGEAGAVTDRMQIKTNSLDERNFTNEPALNEPLESLTLDAGAGVYPPLVDRGTGPHVFQLTNNDNYDTWMKINKGAVVWQSFDGQDYEIYYWRVGLNEPKKITDNNSDDWYPQIDNGTVVWHGYRSGSTGYTDIYYWREDFTSPKKITTSTYGGSSPQINNGAIVWNGYNGTTYAIYYWKISTDNGSSARIISGTYQDNHGPQIKNGEVVWYGNGSASQIFYWRDDGSNAPPQQISSPPYTHIYPQVDNGSVVWSCLNNQGEIYFWREGNPPKKINDNNGDNGFPVISNGVVAWSGNGGPSSEIFYWEEDFSAPEKLTDNGGTDTDPKIANGVVVWMGVDNQDTEIYYWHKGLTRPIKMTNNSLNDKWACIDNYMIVWQGDDGHDDEIFLSYDITPPEIVINKSGVAGNNGWYSSNVKCEAAAVDEDSAAGPASGVDTASWFFTATGAEVRSGTFDQVMISSEGSTFVDFSVKDRLGNKSESALTVVNIDTTPPIITLTDAPNGWATAQVHIGVSVTDALSGPDPARIAYRINSGALIPIENEYIISTITASGNIQLSIEAYDIAGNFSVKTVNLKIENTAPTITVKQGTATVDPEKPDNPFWRNGNCSFSITATDNGGSHMTSIGWELRDSNNAVVGSGDKNNNSGDTDTMSVETGVVFPENKDGRYTLHVTARDKAGNNITRVYYIGLDRIGPTVYLSDSFFSDTIDINGQIITPTLNQIIYYRAKDLIRVSDTTIRSGANVTLVTTGTVEIPIEKSFAVEAGATFTITLGRNKDSEWANGAYAITGTAFDATSGVDESKWKNTRIRKSDNQTTVYRSNLANQFDDGEYAVVFEVADLAGNIGTASCDVKYDNTAPTITLPAISTVFGGKNYTIGGVTFTAAIGDNLSGVASTGWSLSGPRTASGAGSTAELPADSPDGEYIIRYTAQDVAGNSTWQNLAIVLDRTGPVISISESEGGSSRTASAIDAGVVYLDEDSWEWSQDVNWSSANPGRKAPLSQLTGSGTVTIYFRVKDVLGNWGTGSTTVKIDRSAPEITPYVVTGQNVSFGQWTNLATVQVSANLDDGLDGSGINPATRQVSINGSTFIEWNGGVISISPDPYNVKKVTVTFAVRDLAGNQNTATREIWFDRKGPTVQAKIDNPNIYGKEWTNTEVIRVTGDIIDGDLESGADNSTLEYSFDQINWITGNLALVNTDGVTPVYLRGKDIAGNIGTTSIEIWRDTVGPKLEVAGSVTYNGLEDSVHVGMLTASDVYQATIKNWRYRFESGTYASLPYATPLTGGVIPNTGLGEGIHTLWLYAEDNLGNGGEVSIDFSVDKTGPDLSRVDILDNGKTLSDTDYTDNPNLQAAAVLSDTGEQGISYRYAVRSDSQVPTIPASQGIESSPWILKDLVAGTNYLFVWAFDLNGNPSSPRMRIIRLDTGVPGKPEIKSQTHLRAINEQYAVPLHDADFVFKPTTTGSSGLAGYAYRLLKGTVEIKVEITQGMSLDGMLSLNALNDNELKEFYFLEVAAVGSNNKRSLEAEYRFRIDTQPPKELVVGAVPQVDAELFFNNVQSTFTWNKPRDMTGVKTYYYCASAADIVLPQNDVEKAAFDFTTWTATNDQSRTLNLDSLVNPAQNGSVWFAVAAVDYAGNRAFAKTKLNFDWVKPWLDQSWTDLNNKPTALFLESYSATSRTCIIQRGTAHDVGSDVANVLVYRSRLEGGAYIQETNWQTAGTSMTVDGLDPSAIYLFTYRVTDNASNFNEYEISVSLVTGVIDISDQLLPYSANVDGYDIYGMKSANNMDSTQLFLKLPAQYSAHRHNAGTGIEEPIAQFEFNTTTLQFDGDTFVSGMADQSLEIDFWFAGFHIRTRGLSLNRTTGLSAGQIVFEKTVDGASGSETRSIAYHDVNFSFPPLELFVLCGSDTQAQPFGITTYTYSGKPETPTQAWQFSALASTSFRESSWILTNALLLTQPLFDTYSVTAYRLNMDLTRDYRLAVPLLSVNYRNEVGESPLSVPFTFEFGDNEFLVERAFVKADRIVVLKARLVFNSTVTADEIYIENFSVDAKGQVHEEAGFKVTGMTTLTDSLGRSFLVSTNYSASFVGQDLMINGVSLALADGTNVSLSSVRITKNGPDPKIESVIAQFNGKVHGYTVESTNARLTAKGVRLVTAVLKNMPQEFSGGDWDIEGLEVSLPDYSVVTAGTNNALVKSFTPPYGKEVTIHGITMNAEGLFAQLVDVTLPDFLGGGKRSFPLLKLVSDGTFGQSYATDGDFSFNISGFNAIGTGVTFDGQGINFYRVTVTFAGDCSPNVFEFTGFRVNYTALIEEGHSAQIASYRNSGWEFSLVNPALDLSGIKTVSRLILPYAFGGRELVFDQFQLLASGDFNSGVVNDTMTVRLFGWRVDIAGISLVKNLLAANTATVQLYSIMGFASLVFPNLKLLADGSVDETSGFGKDEVSFLATNGFKVTAGKYAFKPNGLRLNGSVFFPSGLGESSKADYANWEISLDQDGVVTTEKSSTQTMYRVAGFNIRASGYWFDRSGLNIDTNVLEVNVFSSTLTFNLPSIQFFADGEIKVGGSSFEGWSVDLCGFQAGITAIKLTKTGLNLKAFITLPPSLGDISIYFDQLTLHPDGTVTTDVAVKELPEFDVFSVKFKFRNIRLSEEGFSIGEGIITLPAALDSKKITITQFKIKSNGSFEIGNIGLDPFELLGFTFYTNSLSLENNVISFTGSIKLPENLPEGLAGERLLIDAFSISLNTGEITAFSATLAKTFEFDLIQDWKLRAQNINVEKRENGHYWVGLKELGLKIPDSCSWLPVKDLSISDMAIDPMTGEFDWKKITITSNTPMDIVGFTFTFGTITFSKSGEVVLDGSAKLPSYFPSPFTGAVLVVRKFQLLPGGGLGTIDASLDGLHGELFGMFDLSGTGNNPGASIGFANADGKLTISCYNAVVTFKSIFPAGIAGESVTLAALKMGIKDSQFTLEEFSATTSKLSPNIFGLLQLKDLIISMKKDPAIVPKVPGEDVSISATGKIVLPNSLPIDAFKGKEINLRAFKLNLAGELEAFSAGISLAAGKEENFLAGLKLAGHPNTEFLTVEYKEVSPGNKTFVFDIIGDIIFSNTFPEGIAGTRCIINKLEFNTNGEFTVVDARANFVDQKVFGLTLKNGSIAFDKNGETNLLIGITGNLVLPDALQQAGQPTREIKLTSFSIFSNGIINTLDGTLVLGDVDLFDVVKLTNASVRVFMRGADNEIVIAGAGGVKLPDTLPAGLAGLEFRIRTLEFSTMTGALTFDVGLASGESIDFEIFAGIKASVTQLDLNNTGFAVAGSLRFPSEGFLPKEFIRLDGVGLALAMHWDGTLVTLSAVLGNLGVSVAGFNLELTNLSMSTGGITCQRVALTLPAVIGGSTITVNNAYFDKDGKFHGEFGSTELNLVVAGFGFNLRQLAFDIDTGCIKIGTAVLKLPDFIHFADMELYNVTIDTNGLQIGGGLLKLPDFSVGGLGFTDCQIAMVKEEGLTIFKGQARLGIPGAGSFFAAIAFTSKTTRYPWGLKYAVFEWTADTAGIPIGTTPLFLYTIRGSLAFGPVDPIEQMPPEIKALFSEGTRVSLGVGVRDITGGALFKGSLRIWIDITNWDWAFCGQVSVYSGFIQSEIIAALTHVAFYGKLWVRIAFAEGQVEIWIWNENGQQKFAGQGNVKLGLAKGSIFSGQILFWYVEIPWDNLWLISGGAKLGDYKNGRSGIVGWVEFLSLKLGILLPSGGGFEFVNSEDFVLSTPVNQGATQPQALNSTSALSALSASEGNAAAQVFSPDSMKTPYGNGRARALDRSYDLKPGVPYRFVSKKKTTSQNGKTPTNGLSKLQASQGNTLLADTNGADASPQPVGYMFFISYKEGDPEVTVTSPSGLVYKEGNPDVVIQRNEKGMIFSVKSSEGDGWLVQVDKLQGEGTLYGIEAKKITAQPEVQLVTPVYEKTQAGDTVTVTGKVNTHGGQTPTVTVHAGPERNTYLGWECATAMVAADGTFTASFDTAAFEDGEYYLWATSDDGRGAPVSAYAIGSIIIGGDVAPPTQDSLARLNSTVFGATKVQMLSAQGATAVSTRPMKAVEKFSVTRRQETTMFTHPATGVQFPVIERSVLLGYSDPNGRRTRSFIVYREHDGLVDRIPVGLMYRAEVYGLKEGVTYQFSVSAIDNFGRESPRSNTVTVVYGTQLQIKNDFNFTSPAQVVMESGQAGKGTVNVNIPSFQKTGSSFDFVAARVTQSPAWAVAHFDAQRWELTGGTLTAGFTIAEAFDAEGKPLAAAPGDYQLTFEFYNLGNDTVKHSVTVPVRVVYLAPVVNSVLPKQWHTLDETSVELYGSHFYPGTTVSLNGRVLAVQEMSETKIKATVPAETGAGNQTFVVTGPDGKTANMAVYIQFPTYTTYGQKTHGRIAKGGTGRFYFTIENEERFTGSATFSLSGVPADWQARILNPTVRQGDLGIIEITVPAGQANGASRLILNNDIGAQLFIDVEVVDAVTAPVIAAAVPGAALRGESAVIVGEGFTGAGSVTLAGKTLVPTEYSDSLIRFTVDNNDASGNLIVTANGQASNAVWFTVKEAGFNLYPETSSVRLMAGDTVKVRTTVSGAKQLVDLTTASQTAGLSLSLSQASVMPNAMTDLIIKADQGLENGTYEIALSGKSGTFVRSVKLTVVVGAAFEITTTDLPPAMEGSAYSAKITSVNGEAPLAFSVSDGEFQTGLYLDETGVVRGTPRATGRREVTVLAKDAQGHTATKKVALVVEENAWSSEKKDEGRTAYNGGSGPAVESIKWRAKADANGTDLLASVNRVFVKTPTGINAYDAGIGTLAYVINGRVRDWVYSHGTLVVLDDTGSLNAYETVTGKPTWSYQGISRFVRVGDRLYAQDATHILQIQLYDVDAAPAGTIRGFVNERLGEGVLAVFKGRILRGAGAKLEELMSDGWHTAAEFDRPVADIAAREGGIFVLLDDGRLFRYDENLAQQASADTLIAAGKLVAAPDAVYIYGASGTAGYAFTDLAFRWRKTGAVDNAAGTVGKLFTAGDAGLTCVNVTNGADVWKESRDYASVVSVADRLFALTEDGDLVCITGAANAGAPVTEMVTAPAAPDGNNGWFKTRPAAELRASDRETFVKETLVKIGNGDWQTYAGLLALDEGQYALSFYSVDSEGYREATQIIPVKIDATAPTATAALSGSLVLPGVYGGPVSLTITAADALSGIDRIEYSIDGLTWQTYTGAVLFGTEGMYTISYRAVDLAGNTGITQSIAFALDTAAPVVWHYLYTEPGLAIVYLAAVDSGSGVAKIEYVLDNSGHGRDVPKDKDPILTYTGPIVVTDKGKYTVFYRAVDKAGRISSWKKVTFDVVKVKAANLAESLQSVLGGQPDQNVFFVKTGDSLFNMGGPNNPDNKIKALPDYLAGAVLLRANYGDRNGLGRDAYDFAAPADLDVYVMKNKDSRADFSGWELVEKNYPVEPVLYFKGGADVYHKYYGRGEQVKIPGSNPAGAGYGNLVFVKYAESNKVRITAPEAGGTLGSGDSIFFSCYLTDLSPVSYKWELKTGEGEWATISDQAMGNYVLPEVEGVIACSLRLTVKDKNGKVVASIARYEIANRAHVRLINPAPGEELVTHEDLDLDFQAYDAEGKELPRRSVTFYVKERDVWNRLYGDRLRAPGQEGDFFLKAVIDLGKGNKQEDVFQFTVKKALKPYWIYFWPHPTGPYCLGHRDEHRPDGKHYGFTADFGRRNEQFQVKDDKGRTLTQGCIRLDGKESFVYWSGQGTFKVKLTVLIEKGRSANLTVNGKQVKLDNAGKDARLFSVELTAAAEAAAIKVSGSNGLGLVDMNVERILPGVKTSPDAIVSPIKGLKVIGK